MTEESEMSLFRFFLTRWLALPLRPISYQVRRLEKPSLDDDLHRRLAQECGWKR